jgi:hypothetical protein
MLVASTGEEKKGRAALPTQSSIANVINSVANQTDSSSVSSRVISAIKNAATKTGVDFSYLLQKASQESGFDPSAKASTSSATGLFQFTSQTWLQMVKTYGAQYGLGSYSSQITSDASGHLSVSSPSTKQAILALRNDPQISAEMAGELDKQNAASLQQNIGGKIGGTELYLAHFLGAGGASNFLEEMRSNPNATAANILPEAAAANPSVFYDKSGDPRTLGQIYQHFAQKFDGNATQLASIASRSTSASKTASQNPVSSSIAVNVASLYPASSSSSSAISPAGFHLASAKNIASAGSSTLFTAMLMGQMEGDGLETNSSISRINQTSDKKKDALNVLSAVA